MSPRRTLAIGIAPLNDATLLDTIVKATDDEDGAVRVAALEQEEREPVVGPREPALELEGMWADMTDQEAREIWGEEVPDPDEDLDR